ncbi:MAG TPA: phosphatase PAP2 family protein [Bryobacteraceae bacterium]|jgi:membrane-associated phospholipid phosphatase
MKVFLGLVGCLAIAAYGQTTLDQAPPTDPQAGRATQQPSPEPVSTQTNQTPAQAPQTSVQPQNNSALGVTPGTQAIKEKDLYEQSGYLHPFRRIPKFVMTDQKRIWTSPFHTSRENIKWWAIFGGATAGLIAADQHIEKAAPSNSTLVHVGNDVSYLGTAYTLIPIAGAFYLAGSAAHEERFRDTGLLSFETLVDATIVQEAIKSITDRQRPSEGQGEGHLFASTNPRYNSSFPSGHAMQTFALASIFAHEYHDKLWVKLLAYTYAGGVVGARLAAKQHFPGDVVAGGAMGWFIGDYVYAKRHNPELDDRQNVLKKVLGHVQGAGLSW